LRLSELAERLQCRLEGDGSVEITRVAGIEDAATGAITFVANPRYLSALRATSASAVILGLDAPPAPCAMLRTAHPYVAFAEALAIFHPFTRPARGVDPHAVVAADATLAPDVFIGPFVSVGPGAVIGARVVVHASVSIGAGAVVGEDSEIHSNVSIRERVVIGARAVIQNGAVIGSDGFGFAQRADGSHQKIPQVGTVVIGDDVEIGANTTIDRPAVGDTRVGAGTKIDNLVQIAHGVSVGQGALLAAQVGIAGSSTLEDRVVLGGQVGVAGHITLGKGTRATAQTGIPNSVDAGAFVSGYPAIENREWLKASAVFRKLPEMRRTISALERRVAELEARLAGRPDPESS
jgi:UDP-3-O-[3-hydroxymyristoyl] glucosamine N-acyltransferase